MVTVMMILVVAVFVCTIASAWNPSKCPLWVAVLLLAVIELLEHFPVGR